MAKRSASPDKLTIKGLSQDDQDWLKAESDRLGCDPENLVRMMIRQRSAPIPPQTDPPRERFEWREDARQLRPTRYNGEEQPHEYDPSPANPEPTINEAEPSLDALMAAPPILNEMSTPPQPVVYTRREDLRYSAAPRKIVPMRAAASYPRGGFDAFTETEFVGINPSVIGSNMMGDGAGNVRRDNLRHFGVKGTMRR